MTFESLDAPAAIAACEAAVGASPDRSRLRFQLARAYYKAGRFAEALQILLVLSAAGHAPSISYLALLYDRGEGAARIAPRLLAEVEYAGWTAGNVLRHAVFKGVHDDRPAADSGLEAEPNSVPRTHPDRLYWPDAGITKQGLAEFYAAIWEFIAPHVVNRPRVPRASTISASFRSTHGREFTPRSPGCVIARNSSSSSTTSRA